MSKPVRPGETALVTGEDFGPSAKIEIARLDDGPAGQPGGTPDLRLNPRTIAAVQSTHTSVKFVLPDDLPLGLFACRIAGEKGASAPALVNSPDPWWAQGDAGECASPGGWLRVFGNCLALPGAEPKIVLRRGEVQIVPRIGSTSCFALTAPLAADCPEGEYEVFVHNGFGGPWGWSGPLKITVARPKPWPAEVFDVVALGADSTGAADSTPAIRAALDKAANGGVVFFPRGRYCITDTLQIPRLTTLRGEGRSLTSLFWPDREQPLRELIKGTNSFGVEDMTLYCSNYVHFIAADQNLPDAGDIHIRRVCIRAIMYRGHLKTEEVDRRFAASLKNSTGGGDLLRLGGRNIEVLDSDLYASGRSIFLDRVRCGRIAGNTIYNGRWGWYCFMGSDGLIFENNAMTGGDLMSTGGGLANYSTPYSRRLYFAGNTFKNMFGWDREAITSDAGGGAYYGKVASANGTALVLAEEPNWGKRDWVGSGVFIVSGRGQGQWREVVRYEKAVVELDRPWAVPPDAESLVEITMQHRHYLMVGNEFFDAGISVQFYGTSIEHIVSGNKSSRAGGFNCIGKQYGGYHVPPEKSPCHQPCWYVQVADNRILEGNVYRGGANNATSSGDSHIGIYGWPPKADWPWPYNRANVVRRNVLCNNARIHLGTGNNPQFPSVADCVVEGNTIRDSDVGIQVDAGTTGVLLRENSFEQVRNPMTGPGLARAAVHPADLALGRLQGIWCLARGKVGKEPPTVWANAVKELQALRARPADDPGLPAAADKAVDRALEALSGLCPGGHSPEFLEGVLGLKLELAKEDRLGGLLEGGTGGAADLALKVSLAEECPETCVSVKIALPPGWACENSSVGPVPLGPAQREKALAFPVRVPAGTWGEGMVTAEVDGTRGKARFQGTCRIPVGGAFVRDWLVIGPFPNKARQPLDPATHPPEDELDLSASYAGGSGPVKWLPVALAGNCLDLGRLLKTTEPATAYALACLVADEEMPMTLGLGSDDGAKVWVNGEEVLSRAEGGRAQPRQERGKVRLIRGENVVFAKVSSAGASWQLYLSIEAEADALQKVHPVPAGSIAALKVFAEAARKRGLSATVPGGPLAWEGEIEWKPVFEDDFSRLTLGGRWRALRGSWAIASGRLVTKQTGVIAILQTVKPPLRIEFDASSHNPGDLTAFWGTLDRGYEGGYFIGFGSNGNTLNKILRLGQQVADSATVLIQKDKTHHVAAQVIALPGQPAWVELLVDGKPAIRYRDPQPVTDANTPGLIAWSEGEFDNVKVYQGTAVKR